MSGVSARGTYPGGMSGYPLRLYFICIRVTVSYVAEQVQLCELIGDEDAVTERDLVNDRGTKYVAVRSFSRDVSITARLQYGRLQQNLLI